MRKASGMLLIILAIAVPFLIISAAYAAPPRTALIMSPLDKLSPMNYVKKITGYLTDAGYSVTFVKNGNVTVSFLLNNLGSYDLVIWRTSAYDWQHTMYWYLGEASNAATLSKYADDVAAKRLDDTAGYLGVSIDFFVKHFPKNSLTNPKLMFLVGTDTAFVAFALIQAGVEAAVAWYQPASLQFSYTDYVTMLTFYFLSRGETLKQAVTDVQLTFLNARYRDPLDNFYFPAISNYGKGNVTLLPA